MACPLAAGPKPVPEPSNEPTDEGRPYTEAPSHTEARSLTAADEAKDPPTEGTAADRLPPQAQALIEQLQEQLEPSLQAGHV